MQSLKETLNEILEFKLINIGEYVLTVNKVLTIILILLVAKLVLNRIKKILFRSNKFTNFDSGSLYSLTQIVSYIYWLLVIVIVLDSLGLKITALLTGSAALLVGVGIGLQQTFNDFISGIILLLEGATRVNDVLEIDGEVVQIKQIGLRTSEGLNRDNISIIIPNSKITTDKVINWTHQTRLVRFRIDVGVAYGSDIPLVCSILEQCAREHPAVLNNKIETWLTNFGDSSIDFQLLFYSNQVFPIERTKSDIRKAIDQAFRENNITIPFPQRDVYLKK